jgi:hypothetical protein
MKDLWVSKAEAAQLLAVSPRQIERHEAAGKIRKQIAPKAPGERSGRAIYSRSDLQAIKAGTPNDYRQPPAPAPAPAAELSTRQPQETAPAAELLPLLAQLISSKQPPPAQMRPWLTAAEAAEYSGLPAWWLIAQAEEGHAGTAIDIGIRRAGGRWRFRRSDLVNMGKEAKAAYGL